MAEKVRIRVVAAIIEREDRYLIAQRRPEAILPLLWEFPGGKVKAGESDQDALARKLLELVGVEAEVGPLKMHVAHEYQGYDLDLMVYSASIGDQTPRTRRVHDVRWITPEEFDQYEFPGADQRSVDALLFGKVA